MSVLRGDTRDPAERLALEMQEAAEERPLIGERKGPYAIGENTIGSRLVPEPAQRQPWVQSNAGRPKIATSRQVSEVLWSQCEKAPPSALIHHAFLFPGLRTAGGALQDEFARDCLLQRRVMRTLGSSMPTGHLGSGTSR